MILQKRRASYPYLGLVSIWNRALHFMRRVPILDRIADCDECDFDRDFARSNVFILFEASISCSSVAQTPGFSQFT